MINIGKCQRCGRPLLPGSRADMVYCSGACRAAGHRAMRAGDVLPFLPPAIPGIDDDPAAEAAEAAARAAMAEVARAEEHLKMARRAAKKVYKKAGLETGDMFDGPFVLRETAGRWREKAVNEACAEAVKTLVSDPPKRAGSGISPFMHLAMGEREPPKPSFKEEMAMRRAGTWTEPPPKSEDIAAKFANASPEEQARLICDAAERHRPLKGK